MSEFESRATLDREVLVEQIVAAWLDYDSGIGEAMELAVLAGLFDRIDQEAPQTERMRSERKKLAKVVEKDHDLEKLAKDAIDAFDEISHSLSVSSEHAEEAEQIMSMLLFGLDEICAAATFLGIPGMVLDEVDLFSRGIRAFPEDFASMSPLASSLLAMRKPLPEDPAGDMWLAISEAAHRVSQGDANPGRAT